MCFVFCAQTSFESCHTSSRSFTFDRIVLTVNASMAKFVRVVCLLAINSQVYSVLLVWISPSSLRDGGDHLARAHESILSLKGPVTRQWRYAGLYNIGRTNSIANRRVTSPAVAGSVAFATMVVMPTIGLSLATL